MKKKFLKTLLVTAVMGAMFSFHAYAGETKELIPMDQINVTEDADGSEDGQQGAREYAKQQAGESVRENMGRGYQFRYLSSTAVDSGYYADTEQQGVDVSYHQGYIDWAQVKASGMEFAMIRVGYRGYEGGNIAGDVRFEENIQNALAAGMKVGIYFFSQALTDQEAREEASYTINMIQKYNITYPVVFDWETAPGYRTYDIPLASWQMNDMATAFCDMVASYGYIPMVYSNTTDFKNRYDYASLSSKYYIWYARYPSYYGGTTWYHSGDRKPNYDNNIQFNIWQYMSDGTVPGIHTDCDVNVTFNDFTKVRQPAPMPAPTPTPVEVQLSASDSSICIDSGNRIISGLNAGVTSTDLQNSFSGFCVSVNGNSPASSQVVTLKTGDELVFTPKEAYTYLTVTTYNLAVTGDVDGDGEMNVLDMEKIQKSLLGIGPLTTLQQRAARMTGSDEISIFDMERIQKCLIGLDHL